MQGSRRRDEKTAKRDKKGKNMENDEIKQKIIDAMEIAGYKPISFSYRVNHFRAYMPVVSVDFKKGSKTVRVNVYNGDLNSVMVYIDDYYISLPILNVAGWLENR